MKKLNLEKFTILKINDLSKISGGGDGDGDNGETIKRLKCVDKSKKVILTSDPGIKKV